MCVTYVMCDVSISSAEMARLRVALRASGVQPQAWLHIFGCARCTPPGPPPEKPLRFRDKLSIG